MRQQIHFVRTTIVGGFLVVLPVALVLLLLDEILAVFVAALDPVAELLPVEEIGGVATARLLAIVVVLLAFFVAGLITLTRLGNALGGWLERSLLNYLPGYALVKSLTKRFSPGDRGTAALARLGPGGSWVFAFVVEELM